MLLKVNITDQCVEGGEQVGLSRKIRFGGEVAWRCLRLKVALAQVLPYEFGETLKSILFNRAPLLAPSRFEYIFDLQV